MWHTIETDNSFIDPGWMNMVGQGIANRYVLGERLGSGGMGDVYLGFDQQVNRAVAIKVLKPEVSTPEMVTRFLQEGEALRQLNHPNIVKLLDAVNEGERHYLIMELVEGGTLDDLLKATPQMSIVQVLNIALDLADALTRTHRLNIVHRDIKPGNVLMAADGMPRLTDFGIARVEGAAITEAGNVLGTAAYIAPEIFYGMVADARSDIWSLGVMLFEIVAGVHPFRTPDQHPGAFVHAILNTPTPEIERLRPETPPALADLIYRMLAKNVDERLPRMRLVGAELETILAEITHPQRKAMPAQATAIDGTQGTDLIIYAARSRFETPVSVTESLKNNLPTQTTPFVGRESELAAIKSLVADKTVRLVTIVGLGGMGKTRLALEVAGQLVRQPAGERRFADGVYFVDLAPLTSADYIIGAVAEATDLILQQDSRDAIQQLLDYLRGKDMLLLMDNFEHLVEGQALVQEILQSAPKIEFLVTSREKLNLNAETVFALGGMDVPNWETPEDALEYSAVKLFMQSARRVRSDFMLESGELGDVARICREVQGTPLGILLAAAWLDALSPREIADEIRQSVDFLEAELRDLPPRQRSLRAVFEYSWNLLAENEQMMFAQFSIFRGGFTREAAAQITNVPLRALTLMVNKSLLRRDSMTGRYEIHELLRQFAAEKLIQSPEDEAVYDTHSRYYLTLLAQLTPKLKGFGQLETLNLIETEFENIRAAWSRVVQQRNAELVERALEGLYLFLTFRNRTMDGEMLFGAARAAWQAGENASRLAGKVLVRFPDELPLEKYRRGLEIAEQHGDAMEIAVCQRLIGKRLSHDEFNQTEGIPLMQRSLEGFRALGDKFYTAEVLDDLGWSHNLEFSLDSHLRVVEESLALRREIGDKIGTANSLRNLGGGRGGYFDVTDEANMYWEQAKIICYEMNERVGVGWNASLQAANLIMRAMFEEAEAHLKEAEPFAVEMGDPVVVGFIRLLQATLVGLRDEDYVTAERLIQEGFPPGTPLDFRMMPLTHAVAILASGRRDFEIVRVHLRRVNGLSQFEDEAFYLPMWSSTLLVRLISKGETTRAAELLHAFLEKPLSYHGYRFSMAWAQHWRLMNELEASLRNALGEEAFDAAWARGGAVTYDDLVMELRGFLDDMLQG